jgi:hypothetical protein
MHKFLFFITTLFLALNLNSQTAKITSVDCPNMGFENQNFSGWTGSTGSVSIGAVGASSPVYNIISSVINNSAGNNVSLVNPTNYHTIMTTPPINYLYPNCIGYDSIGCMAIGTNTISQIPVISPFSSDGVSVRMLGAVANYRACRLKYITTTSATNNKLNYSFALVFYEGTHLNNESTYFKAEVKNESTGALLPVCNQSVSVVGPTTNSADSMFVSTLETSTYYRKWQLFTVDLSSLPIGTNVSVNFEVGGCSQGGHFAYAYVDAECGAAGSGGGTNFITCNMCPGSTNASLIAPVGYIAYQWFDPTNNPISGATSNTISVNNPTLGDIYSVQITGHNGCVQTKTITIASSTTTINNIAVTGSCLGGNSGSASANVSGSNGVYSYTWTSVSTGSIVGNSQTIANLSPGSYSVELSSGTCGQTATSVTVPISPPSYSIQYKLFCGNTTFIVTNPGTSYQWYQGSTIISGTNGTNDTLQISNPMNNDSYTVVYTNLGNCKDSIKYIFSQTAGGYVYPSNINNVCSGNSNGVVFLNLIPVNPSPYVYVIKDASGNTISNVINSSTTYSVANLAAGTYDGIVSDGNCTYSTPFTINSIQTNYTMTPGYSNSCSPADTAKINFVFGNVSPANCGLSSSGICSNPNNIQIGNGTTLNTATTYPSVYGHEYKNTRHQMIYTATELLAAGLVPGKISSASFMVSSIPTGYIGTLPGFSIRLKCVTQTSISTVFDNINLVNVYGGTNYTPIVGWNQHIFTSPYEWDGVSNILVDICYSLNTSIAYTKNLIMPSTTTPVVRCIYENDDFNSLCGAVANSPTTTTQRPNIKFENCGASSPSSYSISVSSNGTIVQNYNNDSIKVVPVTTPTADIVYTITVTNPEGGCTSSQTFTMSSNLAAYTTYTNASCGSCPTGSIQVIVSCGTGPYNYVWSPGGQTTSSISNVAPGCYTVTVTDANLNSVTSQACVTFSTKLEDISIANGLTIYPNPSNGLFNLLSEATLEKLDITVINPLGQTVIQESIKNAKQTTVDLSTLSKGIYYLKANTDNGTQLFKLILE